MVCACVCVCLWCRVGGSEVEKAQGSPKEWLLYKRMSNGLRGSSGWNQAPFSMVEVTEKDHNETVFPREAAEGRTEGLGSGLCRSLCQAAPVASYGAGARVTCSKIQRSPGSWARWVERWQCGMYTYLQHSSKDPTGKA